MKTVLSAIVILFSLQSLGQFTGFPEKTLKLEAPESFLRPEVSGRIVINIKCNQSLIDIAKYGYSECDVAAAIGYFAKNTIKILATKPSSAVPPKLSKYFMTIRLLTNSKTSTYDLLDEVELSGEDEILEFYNNVRSIKVINNRIVLE